MKNAHRSLFALALFVSLSCARREAPAAGRDTLYRHLEGDPPTLDPVLTNEDLGLRVEDLIFQPLVGIDAGRRFVPAVARSWNVSSDGLAYEFRLDPNARWEDGSPVTSADVAFTIDRVRDPKVAASNWKWGFEDVVAVETPEEHTVTVRFRRPYAERLLAFNLPIISRAAFSRGGDPGRRPFGSGPYRLESWEPNRQLTLLRRDGMAAETFPFRRVVFRVIPDGAVRYQAGARGELDEFRLSRDQAVTAARSADFQARNRVVVVPQFSIALLSWSFRNPILADRRVRQALLLAWSRAETAKRLYPPDGATLVSGPYPAGVPENDPTVAPPRFDPAESERLLDAAGLVKGPDGRRRRAGKVVSFEFVYPTISPIYTNLAEIQRAALAKIGIELVPRSFDWAAYNERYSSGQFEIAPAANLFIPPNLDPYPYFHSSQAPPRGQNFGSYRNPEADRVMEAAQRELEPSRRLELYRQIHRLLAADPPCDFLWNVDQPWGISKSLDRVEVSRIGLFHFLPGPLGWRPASPRR